MTEQENRAKVLKGLCDVVEYFDGKVKGVMFEEWLLESRKAIAILKAQEPQGTPEAEWLLYKGMRGATCSYCKHTFCDVYDVENYDYYCRHCGAKMIRMRTVKWN